MFSGGRGKVHWERMIDLHLIENVFTLKRVICTPKLLLQLCNLLQCESRIFSIFLGLELKSDVSDNF